MHSIDPSFSSMYCSYWRSCFCWAMCWIGRGGRSCTELTGRSLGDNPFYRVVTTITIGRALVSPPIFKAVPGHYLSIRFSELALRGDISIFDNGRL